MSHYAITPHLLAGGSINAASFVDLDPANDEYAIQSGVGGTAIGVCYPGINTFPSSTNASTVAAVAGEAVTIYGPDSIVEVKVGTAGATRGFVKPDASGFAVTALPGEIATGYIFETAISLTFVRMLVLPPTNVRGDTVIVTAVDRTMTAQESGAIVQVTAADKTITVPAGVVGMKYTVFATGTASSGGSVGTIVHVPTGDTLNGQLVVGTAITASSGKGAVNTHATAITGDSVEIVCLAANTWWVRDRTGVWARES